MVVRPAISAVATATAAMEAPLSASVAVANATPVIRLPALSGVVPMISGLSTMM